MKRVLFAFAALILPQSAFAGFGVTGYLGGGMGGLGGEVQPPIRSGLPTFDWHSREHLVQLDLLGIISSITTEENFGLDAAYYYTSFKGDIHDNWKGTVAPGLHLGYLNYALTDQSAFDAILGLRMGAQALKEMGVGIYVVPGIGIRNVSDDKLYMAMSGSIELSVWLTGGGD